ncbi:MAG TPA: glutamyl-tRNA reductase [Fibrobacteraceae bacterium]|nr:glutamyl-tRNA reductase [Fibrobacteraceae bacterium]
MEAFVIGVNHRTAPLALRGCVAFAQQQGREALVRLREHFPQQGFVLLSTCNRTELYGTLSPQGGNPRDCLDALLALRDVPSKDLDQALYIHEGMAAIRHLFEVTAALDSMLLGEDQILGQVRTAFEEAKAGRATNLFLDILFRHAVTAGKRVKAETGISRNSLSLGSLAVQAAAQKLGDLRGKSALVIGSGKMGALALRNLRQAGLSDILVTVRTKHTGPDLSEQFPDVRSISYDHRLEHLDSRDVIVSATQCPHFTIQREAAEKVLRAHRSHVFLDLAVPRDIDPAVAELPGCAYFDLDQLQSFASDNQNLRAAEVTQAQTILAEELTDLERWWAHRKAMPTLRRLRVNLRRHWNSAETTMRKRTQANHPNSQPDWGEAYGQLAGETLDILFYRLREHCSPDELDVLYRCLDRAFRKW